MTKRRRVIVENVNRPGRTFTLDATKYEAMRDCLFQVLPSEPPGITQNEMFEALYIVAPEAMFPGGSKVRYWAKNVQLDLEAKGIVRRTPGRPLRWYVA